MPTTIESLELQVQQNATSAVGGIDALSASLSRLKNAVKGGVGLNSVANQVRNLDTALKSVDGSSADKINRLADSLSKLKGLGNIKLSSSIGNQLKNISSAASALNSADLSGLGKLSAALQPLNNIGKASGLKSAITQLQKLPQLAQTLNGINWATLSSQLQQLSNSLAPLANQLNTVSNAFGRLPTNIRRVVTATNALPAANNKSSMGYANLLSRLTMVGVAFRQIYHAIGGWIHESNSYIENLNLFNASMGKYTEEARRYAEQVGEVMGIDPGQFMRYQGIFMTITEGFGVASDRAYIMSKNLTQLGYDLSSFFNISFADAMQKLESGISGELEPLRRLGYDLSQARLQQEAWNLGIERNITDMTQAEKAQLRYYAIMTQVTTAQGDMARTLNAPANQLRILQSQVVQAARALGNIFIPILNAVLPYAIALAKVIRILANTIASFFGFKLPEIDYSGVSAGASAVGDLADNAGDAGKGLGNAAKGAKKLKNALLGIDELNIISPNDSSSLGSGGGAGGVGGIGGGDLGFELPEYDFIGDLVNSKVDEIVKMITDALNEITAICSGFMLAIGTILVVTGANIPLGLGLMAAGAVGLASVVISNWDAMSERLAKVLTTVTSVLGGFLLAIGAFLAFSGVNVPLGAGLMVAGATSLATAAAINWKFLNGDMSNALSILTGIVSGALLAMGALFAFTGVSAPLGIALMVAGAVGLATTVGLNWDSMSKPMKNTIGLLEGIVGGALLTFGAILALTGVNTPLGVGMIAAGAVSLVSAVALNWDSLTGDLSSSITSITAIVSGALLGIGAILALTGVATGLGIGMLAVGAVGLAATVGLNWNSMTNEVRRTVTNILVIVGAAALAIGAILAFTGAGTALGVGLMLAGAASIGTAVALNWDSFVNKIKGVVTKILAIAGAAALAIGVILVCTGVGIPLGVGLILAGAASLGTAAAINWDTIKTKVGEALKGIADKFGEFKDWVGEKLEGAKETIQTWASNTKEWFTKGKDGKGIIDHFKDTASKIVGGFLDKIEEKYPGTKAALTEWGGKVKEWFTKGKDGKGLVENFKETAKNVIDGFKNGISNTYETCKEKITTWADKVGGWFKEKLGIHSPSTVFYGYGENTTQGFNNAIGDTYGNTETGISSWAENIKSWFTDNGFGGINSSTFSTFANNTIEGFKTKIGTAYTNVKTNVTTWANKAKEWFTSSSFGGINSTTFSNFANNTIEGFKNKIGSAYSNTKTNITTWASKAKEWFTSGSFGGVNANSFSTFANNAIEGFKNKIGNSYTNSRSNMQTWATNVKNWFSGIASNSAFSGFGTSVIDGFKNRIGGYYTAAKSNMHTFASSVKGWFTDYCSSSSFWNIASDVVNGFSNGIGSLYHTCKNTITSWGSSIIDWFKDKLDINSPSRVFYNMGMFTVKGYDNAISNEGKSTRGIVSRWFNSFSNIAPNIKMPKINAPTIPTARMAFAVDTSALSYYDSASFDRTVRAEVSNNHILSADGFGEAMEKFYEERIEPTFNRMAEDMRRQADKKETTVVKVGNKTVTDAIVTQENANGYSFTG